MEQRYILAIDQGTSSTKSIIFDPEGNVIARGQVELNTYFKDRGFVEQEPLAIYDNMLSSIGLCLKEFQGNGGDLGQIVCAGISNQRETFVVWDELGEPLYNAVVWQCKRSISICDRLISEGLKERIKEITGLIIDPYFSATKLIWLYEHEKVVRDAIDQGRAYFGTVDTWLLFKLSGGKQYLTDHTNASRTMFFNLRALEWDRPLLKRFGLGNLNLPKLQPSSSDFGVSNFDGLFDREIPIQSMIGDSHAAAFGEGCFEKGQAKATLGTGCSIMMNAGEQLPKSNEGIVNTICWSTSSRVDYAMEGVIVSCGSTMEWIKRELGAFNDIKQTQDMALSVADNNGVYIIPAFSGLGAPYWDMSRRAEIRGLTFDSNKNHIVRAGLESIAYQIKDVIDTMKSVGDLDLKEIIVNGGIVSNEFVVRFLTDLLSRPLSFGIVDASGLGAAYLAGLQAGIFRSVEDIKRQLKPKTMLALSSYSSNVQKNHQQWLSYLNYPASVK